jgi:hypothetical protein
LCNNAQDNIYCNLKLNPTILLLEVHIFLRTGKSSGDGKSEEFSPDFVMVSWFCYLSTAIIVVGVPTKVVPLLLLLILLLLIVISAFRSPNSSS